MAKSEVGRIGESIAAAYLEKSGFEILDRNWRCRAGELDLVVRGPDETVVFCEVKCRTGTGYGQPLEAITYAKVRKLRELASHWLSEQAGPVGGVRFDGIGVVLARGFAPVITHIRGIQP